MAKTASTKIKIQQDNTIIIIDVGFIGFKYGFSGGSLDNLLNPQIAAISKIKEPIAMDTIAIIVDVCILANSSVS